MGVLDSFRKRKEPKPDTRPRAAAGRAHTEGFLDFEETNTDLVGYKGFSVFDKMYRTDGDTRQAVSMVCNPIVSGTWKMEPYGGQEADEKAQRHAKIAEWALFNAMRPNLLGHIAEMLPVLVRSGFAPYEQLWTAMEFEGKLYLVPRKLDLRLPRTIERWFQDAYGELVSIVQNLPVPLEQLIAKGYKDAASQRRATNGEWLYPGQVEILARDLVYYRLGAEGDNWEGQSLLRPAYKHWMMKDAIERIDAIAQEREAMGIPICYPPMGATPAQLDAMEQVLASMRTNEQGYIIAPGPKAGAGAPEGQGWLIEVLGYERTGSGRDPQPSLNYHTQKIAAAFISEFMRLGHGQAGARATAQVQADPFLQSVEALTHILEATLNEQLVMPFCAYNLPDCDNPPRLQMSLVDSTSLSQLADYVMKLTQIGALLPDQELEDFLRARADLPPANPESVKKRGKQDDDIRREIVTGGGPNGDAPGTNNGKPGLPHGAKTQKPKSSTAAKQMAAQRDDEVVALEVDESGKRIRYRDLHDGEHICNLDAIEDYLDEQPTLLTRAAQGDVMRIAKAIAQTTPGSAVGKAMRNALREIIEGHLSSNYERGASDVNAEINALMSSPTVLSVRDRGRDGLKDRADHACDMIESRMRLAAKAVRLNHGEDPAEIQLAAETEGIRALKYIGYDHASGAYLQGRHDAIVLAQDLLPEVGVLYSAILDNNTCVHCMQADDGIVRRLDDPVRLDRRPPNRHCSSTASGHNMCRCLEIPALVTE